MGTSFPDLLGLPLEEARKLLAEAGLLEELRLTRPPRGDGEREGEPRVLRQRLTGPGTVELVIAPGSSLISIG